MRRVSSGAVRLTLVLLLWVAPAFALDPENWSAIRRADDPRAYEQVRQRFQQPLANQEYPTVFAHLQRELEEASVWSPQEVAFRHLLQAFTTLNERFATFDTDLATVDLDKAVDEFLRRVPTGLFQFPCPDSRCFKGLAIEVTYDQLEALPDEKAADFLYRLETVNRLLADFKAPALKSTLKAIRDAAKRWELFLREGRSQYPWEAAVNGWAIGAEDIQFPPSRQWILLHPELGVEISTHAVKDLQAKQSLLIDIVGHTWYRWRDSSDPSKGLDYWGLAAVASLRDDMRPGIGVTAHYGRFIHVGVVWRDENRDGRLFNQSPFFVMGIDLFRFAEYKVPQYKKRLEELKERGRRVLSP
ncbi:hypothetical protein [Candidatus Nitrospira bockiana]